MKTMSLHATLLLLSALAQTNTDPTPNEIQCKNVWQGEYYVDFYKKEFCVLANRSKVHQITLQECEKYKTKYGAKEVTTDQLGKSARFCEFIRPEFPQITVRRMIDEAQTIASDLKPAWQYCVETWKKNIGAETDPVFKTLSKDKFDKINGKVVDTPECFSSEPELAEAECRKHGGAIYGSYCRFRNLERPAGSGMKVTYFQNLKTSKPLRACKFSLKIDNATYQSTPCSEDVAQACSGLRTVDALSGELVDLVKKKAELEDWISRGKLVRTGAIDEKQKEIDQKKREIQTARESRTGLIAFGKQDYVSICPLNAFTNLNKMGYPPATFDEAHARGHVKLIQKPIDTRGI